MNIENYKPSKYFNKNRIYIHHETHRSNYQIRINDCCMLSYVAHGFGVFDYDDKKIDIAEGDILFLPPNIQYKFNPVNVLRIETYSCYFASDNEPIKSVCSSLLSYIADRNTKCIHVTDYDNKEIRDIMIQLLDELANSDDGCLDVISSYLNILLVKMYRRMKPSAAVTVVGSSETIDMAVNFIRYNIYNHFSLKDLADDLKLSPSFICRLFKKHMGMTTSELINSMRVNKIKDTLENTNKPIEKITEMFLYHPEYIKKIFKHGTGMTMSEYRAKHHYKTHSREM